MITLLAILAASVLPRAMWMAICMCGSLGTAALVSPRATWITVCTLALRMFGVLRATWVTACI